jgi:dienelactone hydrolase
LVIDHWGSRGITNIYSDYQKNWEKGATSFNMAFDALQGLRALGERNGFTKFGLLGESQGGNAAIWADKLYFYSEYKRVFRQDAPQLSAFVALYPGCLERSFADHYLPLPFLIMSGASDNNTPAALCRRYVDWMNSRGARAQFVSLPNEHHDFDAPFSARKTMAQNPARCASYLDKATRTWDETGEVFPLTAEGNAAFWKKCFQAGANLTMVGGHSGDPKMGFKEWLSFFQASILR